MSAASYWTAAALALHLLVVLALIVRVLLRPHRQPASRIAWVVAILVLPVIAVFAYLLSYRPWSLKGGAGSPG